MSEPGTLTQEHVLQWTNTMMDLYTDRRLMTFGLFRDLFNHIEWYYCKYPDGSVVKLSGNVHVAIDEFNKRSPNSTAI